ncbi:M48 family metalloprotease [Acidobacteriota bacterium]
MKFPKTIWLFVLAGLIVFSMSCATLEKGMDAVSSVDTGDVEDAVKVTQAIRKSFSEITEGEEYYIGRSVAALILSRYPVYDNKTVTTYINRIGQAVAVHSERPEIYAGYHFLVLNTDEVNALAAPGGFIFITNGLLKRCRNEEMIANILSHEVGHVAAKHGLQSIKKSRLMDAFGVIGETAARRFGPEELAELTSLFEEALGDIAEKLIESGYDRKYEYEADKLGVKGAAITGYDPNGMAVFLQTMVDDSAGQTDKGWFKTHPSAKDRLGKVTKQIKGIKPLPSEQKVRTGRFQQAMKSLK